ncbi:MAG: 2-hydroxyglutaryl-CoA dehydratase [Spirochaetes bacterium]|nr:2-hydroxyglutaryl-CoA dehydratase [Deltaproteobacteria bacterium]RKX99727.1 MAG: 2-hydroxyglutaryl-CoA dehydratase [Spirochaetota bacterium]RLA90248.1 MAG: 2-hydroxyglutaryl-CoA dehydratase [Deltaproteobacteria bacterium]
MLLGIDVGSITTKIVAMDDKGDELIASFVTRNEGKPIEAIRRSLNAIEKEIGNGSYITGVGATGSARFLAAHLLGADIVKNEITCHALAVIDFLPSARTVIEIGGQDSKIIILRNQVVVDFAMNTVCAAGTGSFLDHQAERLGLTIDEFSNLSLKSKRPVRIAGRCTVFAETDMIHKQQVGNSIEDIIAGLCHALASNYLNNVGRGKEILDPVVFQGGVAANPGIKKALERELKTSIIVPPHFQLMGAIGAAKLLRNKRDKKSSFKGFDIAKKEIYTRAFECDGCGNQCEVIVLLVQGELKACWGDQCQRYSSNKKELFIRWEKEQSQI